MTSAHFILLGAIFKISFQKLHKVFLTAHTHPALWHPAMRHPAMVQLGSSSRAKHGGAYFSAVFGRKFNPTTVLRPCQPLACCWRVGIAPAPTLFTTSRKHHGSHWCGWSDLSLLFRWICSLTNTFGPEHGKSTWKSFGFLWWSSMAHPTQTSGNELQGS